MVIAHALSLVMHLFIVGFAMGNRIVEGTINSTVFDQGTLLSIARASLNNAEPNRLAQETKETSKYVILSNMSACYRLAPQRITVVPARL